MKLSESSERNREVYDFDRIVERHGTDSVKWSRYEGDVLPLWVADMDFPSPDPVIDAITKRVEHGVFGYGVEPRELRPTVQARLRRLYGWEIQPDDLLFLPGVVPGFNLAARAVGQQGDGILIQTPVYPPFFAVGPNSGRTIEQAPLVTTDRGYEIDFDAFEAAITPSTRMFLLCNPHNPVGRVFTRPELERLAEICLRHDLIICSDEIHQDFVYDGRIHYPIATLHPEVAERTVTLIAPSKSFNIAGFHFSVAVITDSELRKRVSAVGTGLLPNHLGVLDYVAGLAAYQQGEEWLKQVVDYLRDNRDFLMSYLRDNLPGVSMVEPEGTYLAWLDCSQAGIDGSPADFFLREARVGLNEGRSFGPQSEQFVRLNFGCPRSTLTAALERMKGALEWLPGRV